MFGLFNNEAGQSQKQICYMNEIWEPVVGYEGLYEVSNYGRVRSLDRCAGSERIMKIKGIIKKPRKQRGYEVVNLSCNNKWKTKYIHRIVATAFIPNPKNKPQINHINGIKDDNRVENLEWCTNGENLKHAWDNGLKTTKNNYFITNHPNKGKFGKYHSAAKVVIQYSIKGEFIREWGSVVNAARDLGIHHSSISGCCRGKHKTTKGFIWKYK